MRVVHVKAAYTHQTKQFTTLLVTIAGSVFREAKRKVFVASRFSCEYFVMVRAVHRPQVILHALEFHWWEHAVLVVRQVSAGEIHAFLRDVRRDHALVSTLAFIFLRELLEFFNDDGAIGQPKRQTLTYIVIHGEDAKFFSEFAVITLLCFLQHLQILIEFFL